MKKLAVLCFLSMANIAFGNSATIKPYTATYRIKAFGMNVGHATRQLSIDANNHYKLSMDSQSNTVFVKLHATEESEGDFKKNQPKQYHFMKKQGKKIKTTDIKFNWVNQSALSTSKNQQYHLPLLPGVQDKLSYQVKIRKDLMEGKNDLRYTLADDKKIDTISFHITGHEKVKTALGTLDTLKLTKDSDANKRSTIIWVAPKYDYLAVKLAHIEHGTKTTMLIDSYQVAG